MTEGNQERSPRAQLRGVRDTKGFFVVPKSAKVGLERPKEKLSASHFKPLLFRGLKKMPKKLSYLFVLGTAAFFLIFPQKTYAWSGEGHLAMCPLEDRNLCLTADDYKFKTTYPYGDSWHLCLDNQPDCLPRLVTKYYLKKYFLEGGKDPLLLGAAAHLLQDAACPAHWFPMREYFGKLFVPFAPSWMKTIEGEVDMALSQKREDWNFPLAYQGKRIEVNSAYLKAQKAQIASFLEQEPKESLKEIEQQIKIKKCWSMLRSVKEALWLGVMVASPFWVYFLLKWTKTKKGFSDLMVTSLALVSLVGILAIIRLFW